jgi:hypothetical protein
LAHQNITNAKGLLDANKVIDLTSPPCKTQPQIRSQMWSKSDFEVLRLPENSADKTPPTGNRPEFPSSRMAMPGYQKSAVANTPIANYDFDLAFCSEI